jgi:hypothetical protein
LALPNHAGTDWIMINANGRLIHSGHTQQSVLQINTANLPSGVYFLRGTDGQYAWSTVVMKRD